MAKIAKRVVRKSKSRGALPHARVKVSAGWDPEAEVWYIAASSLPGLHLEGATPLELYNQLPGAIEDLLEGSGQQEVSFVFITPVEIMPGRVKIAA